MAKDCNLKLTENSKVKCCICTGDKTLSQLYCIFFGFDINKNLLNQCGMSHIKGARNPLNQNNGTSMNPI